MQYTSQYEGHWCLSLRAYTRYSVLVLIHLSSRHQGPSGREWRVLGGAPQGRCSAEQCGGATWPIDRKCCEWHPGSCAKGG